MLSAAKQVDALVTKLKVSICKQTKPAFDIWRLTMGHVCPRFDAMCLGGALHPSISSSQRAHTLNPADLALLASPSSQPASFLFLASKGI